MQPDRPSSDNPDDFDGEDWEATLWPEPSDMLLSEDEQEEADLQDEIDRYEQDLDDEPRWNAPLYERGAAIHGIRAHAAKLKVPFLFHFTKLTNLPPILSHGLYPRARLCEIGIAPEISDPYRLDGQINGTSLSIGFPNYRMFFKKRRADKSVEWIVLAISRSVLWKKQCAFYRHNAAASQSRSQLLQTLMTANAFASMYEEQVGGLTRSKQKLESFDPTDVQAEVLVFDIIEPEDIVGVAFNSPAARDTHQAILGGRAVRVGSHYFLGRERARKANG